MTEELEEAAKLLQIKKKPEPKLDFISSYFNKPQAKTIQRSLSKKIGPKD